MGGSALWPPGTECSSPCIVAAVVWLYCLICQARRCLRQVSRRNCRVLGAGEQAHAQGASTARGLLHRLRVDRPSRSILDSVTGRDGQCGR